MKMRNMLALFVICVSLFSCQEESLYSCDPEINSMVVKNLDAIKTMSASDWQSLDNIDYKRGVYRALNQEQKVSLWTEKLQKSLELSWSSKEKTHIESLLEHIENHSNLFRNGNVRTDDDEIWLYKWLDYATEELKWDNLTIYALCCTPELLTQNKKIKEINSKTVMRTRSEDSKKICNCGYAHGVLACYHPYQSYNCKATGCEITNTGCGMLWLEKCWGVCYG